jgi:hypothetical protein
MLPSFHDDKGQVLPSHHDDKGQVLPSHHAVKVNLNVWQTCHDQF